MRATILVTLLGLSLLLSAQSSGLRAEQQSIDLSLAEAVQTALLKNLGLRNNAELSRFAIQNQLIEP